MNIVLGVILGLLVLTLLYLLLAPSAGTGTSGASKAVASAFGRRRR